MQFQFWVNCLSNCRLKLANLWVHSGSQIGFKTGPKTTTFVGSFLEAFVLRSWSSSSASWEPLWAPYARLGSLQDSKNIVFALENNICLNVFLRYFEALHVLLGSILALIGPFQPQNEWIRDKTKNQKKHVPKLLQCMTPDLAFLGQLLG